jgi:hypothetical protein
MPTQVTYWPPGHQGAMAGAVPGSSACRVHSQVTLRTRWARNNVTTCRHAATNVAAGVWP